MRTSASDGKVKGGIIASKTFNMLSASSIPAIDPNPDKVRLSVRNCANTRARVAPSDERTATSLCRAVPFASSRLATFAQAIKSTNPTAPINSQRLRISSCGTKSSLRSSTLAPHPVFDDGWSFAMRAVTRSMSACACFRVTPGFRRPITSNQ